MFDGQRFAILAMFFLLGNKLTNYWFTFAYMLINPFAKYFAYYLQTTCEEFFFKVANHLQRVFGHLQMILLYLQSTWGKNHRDLQTENLVMCLHLVIC